MSARPKPRKSSLAQHNPVDPSPQVDVEPIPQAAEPRPVTKTKPKQQRASAAAAQPAAVARSADTVAKAKPRPKVSFYQDPAATERARGAMFHTAVHEGAMSWSEFLDRAVMREVKRLEQKYNDGKPFPSMAAGVLPQGRPMGR